MARAPRSPRRLEVDLPDLEPFGDAGLEQAGEYDALELRDLDLSGQDGRDARFLECGVYACRLDETRLRGARFADCVLADLQGVAPDLAETSWLDVVVNDPRLAAVQAFGADLRRVAVRGGKVDYLNLRGATLQDVRFEGCVLREVDFAEATLVDVSFDGCQLVEPDFSRARLERVDLSGADLRAPKGVTSLAGATIAQSQLYDLAPAFAAQLGLTVLEGR